MELGMKVKQNLIKRMGGYLMDKELHSINLMKIKLVVYMQHGSMVK
jgi:hypothetical protein